MDCCCYYPILSLSILLCFSQRYDRKVGELGGSESVTLNLQEMPTHIHRIKCVNQTGNQRTVNSTIWGSSSLTRAYGTAGGYTSLSPQSVTSVGGSQPHDNMEPFLALNYLTCINESGCSTR